MNPSEQRLWWKGFPSDQPRQHSWTSCGEETFQEKESKTTGRDRLPGPVPDWAEDLFRVARAAFAADKTFRRTDSPDGWTRHITLSVPVADPALWASEAAQHRLRAVLETLSADVWAVEFRVLDRTRAPVHETLEIVEQHRASEVALFSGGLDSLCWAATRATAGDSNRELLLVRFREINLSQLQQQVFTSVKRLAPGRRPQLHKISQTLHGDNDPRRYEPSSRTRGLLYIAAAVRAAAAHGVSTVHVPENGQLALNPPLTPARIAACSTRSVHPWTLHHLNALLRTVNDTRRDLVQVVNPFARLTKGEVCAAGLTAGLTTADLANTVSCGYSPMRRKDGPKIANCGSCFPCLVRPSGLLHATNADETHYERTPWAAGLTKDTIRDWRALSRWLETPFTARDLMADTPMPDTIDITDAMAVITRGRTELERLRELGTRAAA